MTTVSQQAFRNSYETNPLGTIAKGPLSKTSSATQHDMKYLIRTDLVLLDSTH